MKQTKGYRGVEFGIMMLEDGKIRWTTYPKKGSGKSETRTVDGDEEEALAACKKFIDDFLEG